MFSLCNHDLDEVHTLLPNRERVTNIVPGNVRLNIDHHGANGVLDLSPDISIPRSCYDAYSLTALGHEGDEGLVSGGSCSYEYSENLRACENPTALILIIAFDNNRKLFEPDLVIR